LHHDSVDTVAGWLAEAQGACIAFTGAGLSTDSGIPAFRGAGGVWERYPPEHFGTALGLLRTFAFRFGQLREFLLDTASCFLDAQPGDSHHALATLENHGLLSRVVTQNIDGLHELAGNKDVISLHGNFYRGRCLKCRETTVFTRADIEAFISHLEEEGRARLSFLRAYRRHRLRCARCGSATRPDMVLFGERLQTEVYERAARAAETCELILVIGTSVLVRPASDIPFIALRAGARVVEVNTEPTELSELADLHIETAAEQFLPALLARVELPSATGR